MAQAPAKLWTLGGLGGICVDAYDHVFILNRQDVNDGDLTGARLAPMIIEFDPAGNVVNSMGDNKVMDQRLHHRQGRGHLLLATIQKAGGMPSEGFLTTSSRSARRSR